MAWSPAAWADEHATGPFPDVLLVLAGGVDDDGVVHPSVARRLDAAAELHSRSGGALPIVCNGGGTAHKPRWCDAAGFAVPEAQLMADGLRARGVPVASIYLEALSDDSIGNALAARLLHTDPRPGWRAVWVLTSDFQAARAHAIYAWALRLAPSPAAGGPYGPLRTLAVPDGGAVEADALAARAAREAASLAAFLAGVGATVTTIEAAHEFMFARHGAYAPRTAARVPLDAATLKTY